MGILLFRLCFAQARIIRSTRVNSMLPWAPSEVNKKAVHEIVILLSPSNVVLRRADALWRDSLRFLWCYAPIKSCGLARLMACQAEVFSPKKRRLDLKPYKPTTLQMTPFENEQMDDTESVRTRVIDSVKNLL